MDGALSAGAVVTVYKECKLTTNQQCEVKDSTISTSRSLARSVEIALSRPTPIVTPVTLGASGDDKYLSFTVTGDHVGSMPSATHLFQVFFESTSPCILRPPPPLSSAVCILAPSTFLYASIFHSAVG